MHYSPFALVSFENGILTFITFSSVKVNEERKYVPPPPPPRAGDAAATGFLVKTEAIEIKRKMFRDQAV